MSIQTGRISNTTALDPNTTISGPRPRSGDCQRYSCRAHRRRSGLGLVLATDGARLSEEALRDLPRWLEAIDVHQRDTPVSQWETGSDDLALIHVKRRP